jgi:hypothetical protein
MQIGLPETEKAVSSPRVGATHAMLTDIGTQHRVFVMDASQLLAESGKRYGKVFVL